jgi:hypothetical protein
MQKFLCWFVDIIMSPTKSLATTLSTAATGSLIELKMSLLQVPANTALLETCLRNGAWMISIIVGGCSIYSFVDKQISKHKNKKK